MQITNYQLLNFTENYYFNGNDFSISNKFEYLRLISKSAERNHSNYRRSGNRKSTIIDGLIKVLLLPRNFQRSNLRGKKQGIEQLFRKPLLFSELLEGRKKQFVAE
jgi:hypothetical protein